MQYRRGVVSIWSMFVFLTMLTLYQDGRLTGFAQDTKTSGAAKVYWRRLNSKRSLPVLKWVSESEYFEKNPKFFYMDTTMRMRARGNYVLFRCANPQTHSHINTMQAFVFLTTDTRQVRDQWIEATPNTYSIVMM